MENPDQSLHLHTPPQRYPFLPPYPPIPANLNYDLSNIVSPEQYNLIESSGIMSFHCIGDSGGDGPSDNDNRYTKAVADFMQSQCIDGKADSPCFCYHVGDVVYPRGEWEFYPGEFYEPYINYSRTIVAIPGNHDSYSKPMLGGFMNQFLSTPAKLVNPIEFPRELFLPYYYWTLDTPVATIIGLAAISSQGIDSTQQEWFTQQLINADPGKCLIVAIHYPPFSYGTGVPGDAYAPILNMLNTSFNESGRVPTLVLSGHSHNYQRLHIKQKAPNSDFVSVISGAGGNIPSGLTPGIERKYGTSSAQFLNGFGNCFGALKITIDSNKRELKGEFVPISIDPEPVSDTFTLTY